MVSLPPMVSAPDAPDGYTPFVPRARQALADALARFFGLDAPVTVTLDEAAVDDRTPWRVCVRVTGGVFDPPVRIELRAADPAAQAWYRGRHVSLGYRKGDDGADPTAHPALRAPMAALRARVERLDRDDGAPETVVLREAVARFRGFAKLHDRHFRYTAPREAIVRLGFRCNQRCDFCWQGRDWADAPDALYHQWVDEFADAGRTVIHFTGGEPTLHRELPALVRRAHGRGMSVWLQTNAVRLAKRAYLDELVAAGLTGLFVSHHAHRAEVSDAMTLAPGTHARTEEGLAHAMDAGLRIVVNTLVERRNLDGLADHARHLVERFVKRFPRAPFSMSYSYPSPALDDAAYAEHLAPLDAVAPKLLDALRVFEAAGVAAETGGTCGLPPCVFREAVRFARFDPPGSYDRDDARDRTYVDACARCVERPRCVGLRASYVRRFGGLGVVPFTR